MPYRNRDFHSSGDGGRYARDRTGDDDRRAYGPYERHESYGRPGARYDVGAENRGEPYYNEPGPRRFGEPRGRAYAEDIERGAYGPGEPWYAAQRRELSEEDWGPADGSFGRYGEHRGGGRWTSSPDLPRYPGGRSASSARDASYRQGAYYYGPGVRDEYADEERYDAYGRDLGANWTRPQRYPGYAETQGHSARGAESYRGRGPKGYVRSDERIKEDVSERLADDERVDASDITVTTSNGTVSLDGTVPQRWMKYCAEDVVEGCSGVKDVQNRLSVRREESASRRTTPTAGDPTKKH